MPAPAPFITPSEEHGVAVFRGIGEEIATANPQTSAEISARARSAVTRWQNQSLSGSIQDRVQIVGGAFIAITIVK
jgi:hypothetical protein